MAFRFRGEQLRPEAREWNAMLEAAEDFARRKFQRPELRREPYQRQQTRIRSRAHQQLDRWAIVGLGAPIFPPADTSYNPAIELDVALETAAPVRGRWGVVTRPVASGGITEVIVAGITIAAVDVTTDTFKPLHCEMKTGNYSELQTMAGGSAQILWRPSGATGVVPCVIRLGIRPQLRMFVGTASGTIGAGTTSGVVQPLADYEGATPPVIGGVHHHGTSAIASGKTVAVSWDDNRCCYFVSMEFC